MAKKSRAEIKADRKRKWTAYDLYLRSCSMETFSKWLKTDEAKKVLAEECSFTPPQ